MLTEHKDPTHAGFYTRMYCLFYAHECKVLVVRCGTITVTAIIIIIIWNIFHIKFLHEAVGVGLWRVICARLLNFYLFLKCDRKS